MNNRLLVSDEKEGMLSVEEAGKRNGSANCPAKLVPLERVDCLDPIDIAEVVRRVEYAIANIFKQIAVKLPPAFWPYSAL